MNIAWTAEVPDLITREAEDDEQRLIRACRGGDERAFARLVKRHERRVFRLAGRFFRSRDQIEDAAQETFLAVWTGLASYRADAPFEHWLTRVCLNCCYKKLRKKRPEDALPEEHDPPAPRRDPDARLEVARLLDRLAPEDRFVLQLLDGEGWNTREIAERLGWSRINVKVRAHRARKRLRALLET